MTEHFPMLFDRALLRKRRARAAPGWRRHDVLKRESAARLAERVGEMRRHFSLVLDIGCHHGEMRAALAQLPNVGQVISADSAEAMLRGGAVPGAVCVLDEEAIPFAPATFDLITSALSLHHVNDLPGTLIQLRQCLKPDGALLVTLFGASSLSELRRAFTHAAAAHGFPLSPRLSPLIEIRDAGALLGRAGLALPVLDTDLLTLEYPTPLALLHELRGMGESHALFGERHPLSRAYLAAALAQYAAHHSTPDGYVTASVEFITLLGWKPDASQPRPLAPGSAAQSLKDVL